MLGAFCPQIRTCSTYVDDFTFFSNSQELLEDLKIKLQQILNEYRLRINGNKTKLLPCIFDCPKVDLEDIRNKFSWLTNESETSFTYDKFINIKKYVAQCIQESNFSQIKTCITLIYRKITNDLIIFENTEEYLLSYLIQLSQTQIILSCKIYKLIDAMLNKSKHKDKYIKVLLKHNDSIDNKYSNTILQIWHYYTITNNCDNNLVDQLINNLNSNNNNPLILSLFVKNGKKSNTKLFKYILKNIKN